MILFSPQIHSLSQTGRKLEEVTPELCDPEQQPWAMGHSCLPSLPGPGGSGEPGLHLLYECSLLVSLRGKKVENVSFFEKKISYLTCFPSQSPAPLSRTCISVPDSETMRLFQKKKTSFLGILGC